MFFLHPADVKDTGFLTYDYDDPERDDDQWLYLPALRKTKRIASSDKSGSFMGSGLNYSDMTSRDLEDYDYTFDEFQWVVRLTRDFLNETLTLTLLASTYGTTGQDGAFQRFSVEYDITDAFSVNAGLVTYQSGDKAQFKNIGDNDRLFFEFKYSF